MRWKKNYFFQNITYEITDNNYYRRIIVKKITLLIKKFQDTLISKIFGSCIL
jgi:hypothetical protein